ncbi:MULTISPECIES: VOC family protein [unclassified Burkholderia]|uniref:VOC family protein n=1 Tax=unclassified Burkholderia TaxID=2613784 RepID=UPI000F5A6B22|nr:MULTISPECIES: hypothetical protein [unclassified Burkholderia]
MIDHVYISVTDIEKSLIFYSEALKPLGWSVFGNYDSANGPASVPDLYGIGDDVYGKGEGVGSSIWLRNVSQARPGFTWGSSAIRTNSSTLPTQPQSRPAASMREDRRIVPTSPPATTPPTSPTSTATVSSSYTRRGTPSDAHSNPMDARESSRFVSL